MCATCGCGGGPVHADHSREHPHADHAHEHPHRHAGLLAPPAFTPGRIVRLEQDVLAKNDAIALRNRAWLGEREILALNLVSSPGAGKTTLLERTLREVRGELPVAVVEGDQETPLDAERIRAAGCPVLQINTGRGCHLDAAMISDALRALDPPRGALLFIENVGNLVCPAMFDLGEHAKVVVASTPEGADKPLKYPHMFRAAKLMLLNKIDLAPHVAFDEALCISRARQVNPALEVLSISAARGDGLDRWYAWLHGAIAAIRHHDAGTPKDRALT
ncbi:MAG TPA: hydrogenase nickel incorporation protein HypB [Anaeromyxobacteraceae bacterium]|nr:hydrogenase nickel incorporation protein HypB [Anaeromyxobacteraceae bacterium]